MLHRGRKNVYDLIPAEEAENEPKTPQNGPEPPPEHLSEAMAAWWEAVVRQHHLEPHHLRLLEAAATAWDRMTQARSEIADYGITYVSKKGDIRGHPAVAIERDARIAFARLVRELNLDPPAARPVGGIGWMGPDAQ